MNYYDTLNINPSAEPAEIKRAYYAAVKKHSPDKDPEIFKEVRSAYVHLSNPAKRKEYDKLLQNDLGGQIMRELLENRVLLENHRYKEVTLRLTEQKKPKYDNPQLNVMLARAYLGMGKTGLAETLSKEVLKKEPDNADAIVVLTTACNKRGHVNKVHEYFLQWIDENPNHPVVWERYLAHVNANFTWALTNEIDRAFNLNKGNLKEASLLYLIGCNNAMKNNQPVRALEFLEEYVKCLEDGCELCVQDFEAAVTNLSDLIHERSLRACIASAIPILRQYMYRFNMDEEPLALLETYAEWVLLSKDERIHEVFRDLTEHMIENDGCNTCKQQLDSMELYVIHNLDETRPSVKAIKDSYPKLYELHARFFNDVLDERKEETLMSRGARTSRKLAKSGAFDNISFKPFEKPFVRETQKIGRNAPCPCGSGKKYKRCCG